MAVKERKYYETKVISLIAEKAEVLGLAKEMETQNRFVGYMVIDNGKGEDLFEITLMDAAGNIGNVITKSENVIKQIDEIMTVMEGEDRNSFTIGFQVKDNKGKTFIVVTMGLGLPAARSEETPEE